MCVSIILLEECSLMFCVQGVVVDGTISFDGGGSVDSILLL